MRTQLFRLLLSALFLLMIPANIVLAETDLMAADDWETVASGIEYRKFHLTSPRPIDLFVTRMDRSNTNVIIESSLALGKNSGGIETVRDMAERYDQAINYWGQTWGNRNNVVVAINGYFFNTLSSQGPIGVPWSGQVHSGWYAKRFDNFIGDAGFAWMMDRSVHIGDCVYHVNNKQLVYFEQDSITPYLEGINVARSSQELILYTPQFDAATLSDSSVLEILVEMNRPASVLPPPNKSLGYIREIRDQQSSTPIPFDHIVLSAWGDVCDTLLSKMVAGKIAVGDQIGFSHKISDCETSPTNNWTNTYASMGGDYHFLNDGVIRTDFNNPDASWPNSRTAIAYNADYVYFIVTDRWNPGISEGITIEELADFVKNTLKATDAVTQDSGGSSTMVINGTVVNNTTCNFTDCRPSGDAKIQKISPNLYMNPDEGGYGVLVNQAVAPLVANGMMMVLVEPETQSGTFSLADSALTKAEAEIRLGPGTNYAVIGAVPENATCSFLNPLNQLNGILAKGSYWWKVEFDGLVGWLQEELLHANGIFRIYFPIIFR